MESGDIDPSRLTQADVIDLARKYREAVGVIDQQKRLIDEANRVIIKLQTMLQELRDVNDQTDENRATDETAGIPAGQRAPTPGDDANT